MALLKKYISRNTFLTLMGIWNASSVYVTVHFGLAVETVVFIVTVGNLVISWLGVESGNMKVKV